MTHYYYNRARGKKAIIRERENKCVVTIGMFDTTTRKTLKGAKSFLENQGFREISGDTYRSIK